MVRELNTHGTVTTAKGLRLKGPRAGSRGSQAWGQVTLYLLTYLGMYYDCLSSGGQSLSAC